MTVHTVSFVVVTFIWLNFVYRHPVAYPGGFCSVNPGNATGIVESCQGAYQGMAGL